MQILEVKPVVEYFCKIKREAKNIKNKMNKTRMEKKIKSILIFKKVRYN